MCCWPLLWKVLYHVVQELLSYSVFQKEGFHKSSSVPLAASKSRHRNNTGKQSQPANDISRKQSLTTSFETEPSISAWTESKNTFMSYDRQKKNTVPDCFQNKYFSTWTGERTNKKCINSVYSTINLKLQQINKAEMRASGLMYKFHSLSPSANTSLNF